MAATIARVMVDSPLPQLDRLFDYSIPPELASVAVAGVRVRVPLRSAGRVADGYLIEVVESVDYTGTLSELESVVSPVPVLTPDVWALARRAADRAAGSASDVIRLAVPPRQARVEKAYVASGEAPQSAAREATQATTHAKAEAPPPIEGYGPGIIESALARNERLAVDAAPYVEELPDGSWVGGWAVTLARAAASVVRGGRSAILCVPDYRDQEQLESALLAVLPPERLARLDARQSNPDRYRAFLRCLGDAPLAIIGNRSVIYAPAAELGLIALWDDGDPLHAEPLAPYVHSRDAALLRQEQQGCALMFLGHSRSTEVERLVEVGWVRSVAPDKRILPKVVPTANQPATDRLAARARIPSTAWQVARAALDTGPVLVQVARPGYAPGLACLDCDQLARCQRCEGPLAQKTARAIASCLWCGALAVDWTCDNCGGDKLRSVGAGATRTAEDLGRAFPGVRVIIADGERPITTVGPEPALIIATRGAEPIAAGGYRAVLLLDGERMLARESLRVAEDCLRWWSNAIALAAGGATTVLVGVGGSVATALVTWRQADFVRSELADRRRLRFPPAVRVATVTGTVEAVTRAVTQTVAELGIEPTDVLGPVELPTGVVRTILRFDYARGTEVAADLRAQLIKAATSRRRPAVGKGPRVPVPPPLRVRFDDGEPFLEH